MSVRQQTQSTSSTKTSLGSSPRLAIDLSSSNEPKKQPSNQPSSCKQLTIRWTISRRAITNYAPSGSSPTLQLQLIITPIATSTEQERSYQSAWSLIDPKSNQQTSLPQREHCQLTQSQDYICIQSPSLCCVIRSESSSGQLIYARTDLFKSLSIPGGRYHTTGCHVQSAE